jgi:hypothetical protein
MKPRQIDKVSIVREIVCGENFVIYSKFSTGFAASIRSLNNYMFAVNSHGRNTNTGIQMTWVYNYSESYKLVNLLDVMILLSDNPTKFSAGKFK